MKISIRVTTLTGSITGNVMQLEVDSSLSVRQFKFTVQEKAHDRPDVECGPTRPANKQVTPDFQRVFVNGAELTDDEKTLQQVGVKNDSELFFAVRKGLGKKLRGAMRGLDDTFPQHNDCDILGSVLRNLKGRWAGDGSTELLDELYEIFDADFEDLEGVRDGCLTLNKEGGGTGDYIQWAVDEEVPGSFPFKTYYGIPAYTRPYSRQYQALVGHPHPRPLVVTQAGQQ